MKGMLIKLKKIFPKGIWPVMLTPFTKSGAVDYEHIQDLVDWYIKKGVHGIFAVCQSSEMFFLNREERLAVAKATVAAAQGRVPVIASGHVSDSMEEQIIDVQEMAKTGVDAVVLITNRFAKEEESDEVWLANLQKLLAAVDTNVPLGLYECPYPYKRLISDENLKFCGDSGRFYFLKDTCCDLELLNHRVALTKNTPLVVYNACCALVLDSLRGGAGGFSGVMANIHPEFYRYLFDHYQEDDQIGDLQSYLTLAALIERQVYPTNAKYYLQKFENLPIETYSRVQDNSLLGATQKKEIADLARMNSIVKAKLKKYE